MNQCKTTPNHYPMAFLKSKSKNPVEVKKEILLKLGKIWSVINNLAQERRIRSEELDDFNQAYCKLDNLVDALFQAVEMLEKEASGVELLKLEHAAIRNKLELCLELCGMSKKGIEHLMNYPIGFLEMAFALRLREGKPLETDRDFIWLDQLWKAINMQIENDIDSFKQANFFKKLYHEATNQDQKRMTIKVMNDYARDLVYLRSKLGKEVDERDLLNTITTHWYEEYRNCTAIENR